MQKLYMLTGVVLAGGRSRRMGRDKADLAWNGLTLLEHACALLDAVGCARIRVSGRSDHPDGQADKQAGQGPGRALTDLLRNGAAGTGGLLVIPVDMPKLTAEDLLPLIRPGSLRARIWTGRPLPAWFPSTDMPAGHESARSIRDVLALFDVETLTLDASQSDHFDNINTAEDFARLEQST